MLKYLAKGLVCALMLLSPFAMANGLRDVDYLKRQAEWAAWMQDVRTLKVQNEKDLPGIIKVEQYLSGGTLMRPLPDGRLVPYDTLVPEKPPLVLVLFPEDKLLSPVWRERYGDYKNGTFVLAQFMPDSEILLIRAEKINSISRGALLAHEGYHGVHFNDHDRKTVQTDQEYCTEEAIANAFQASLVMGANAEFRARIEKVGKDLAKTLYDKNGMINLKLKLDEQLFVKVYGPQLSDTDLNVRAMEYRNAVLFKALRERNKKDKSGFEAMDRFARFLCSEYKQHGIR
jgi:hypothetical protein